MKMSVLFKFTLLVFILFVTSCKEDKDCSEGFTGENCDQQLFPKNIKASNLTVLEFPNSNNGATWDANSAPDIYPIVSIPGSTVVFNPSIIDSNAISPGQFVFTGVFDINPRTEYRFELKDYDEAATDQTIGRFSKVLYNTTNGFPSNIRIEEDGVVLTLDLQYEF